MSIAYTDYSYPQIPSDKETGLAAGSALHSHLDPLTVCRLNLPLTCDHTLEVLATLHWYLQSDGVLPLHCFV